MHCITKVRFQKVRFCDRTRQRCQLTFSSIKTQKMCELRLRINININLEKNIHAIMRHASQHRPPF